MALRSTLGDPIPAFTEHAISVSLPKWADNVGYEEGESRVLNAMKTGYPRFFIHLNIRKVSNCCRLSQSGMTIGPHYGNFRPTQLSSILEQKFGTQSEKSLLFPSRKSAEACRTFLTTRDVSARVVQHCISEGLSVFLVLFPEGKFDIARQFWQHTGLGISSRLATHILATLASSASPPPTPTRTKPMAHRHYSAKPSRRSSSGDAETLEADQAVYLEQRYGRNLDVGAVNQAKGALRRRIAGLLVRDESAVNGEIEVAQSVRGAMVTEDDVFLFQTGMSAIWTSHQIALDARGARKSVCFGLRPSFNYIVGRPTESHASLLL
jgi:cystathionine gamma-synthase